MTAPALNAMLDALIPADDPDRIPEPEEQARYVCGEILSRDALTTGELLELAIPRRLLG